MSIHRIKITPDALLQKKSVITIGNFDGMHLGHMSLINQANQIAQIHSLKRVLVTFEPYTHEFFAKRLKKTVQARLSLLRDKYNILSNLLLVDELVVIRFNQTIANMSADDFIQDILIDKLNADTVIMGSDFRFGRGAQGSHLDIMRHGISVISNDKVQADENAISSTRIRACIDNHDLNQALEMLGHNLTYTSRIIHGLKNGRKFGIPTINLYIRNDIIPAVKGIYVTQVTINQKIYQGIASIGLNPTIDDTKTYKFEVHLLDTDEDLYGQIAHVEILKFVRDEAKFNSIDELIKQIHWDIQQARNFFALKKV